MSTRQQPLPSGFGHRSTADDVLAGSDLRGRLAIVTGGYSGLGFETVAALAKAGAQVVVPARRRAQAEQTLAQLTGVIEVDELDLADLDSVHAFARRFLESRRKIDLQINNAAIMASPLARVGPGWESQFATNHLGHYVLTNLLWPALTAGAGARVISLSSTGHKLSPIRFDDPQFETTEYDKWIAYGQAKTANSLFAVHLDRLGAEHGVRAFAVHPGGIMTELQRHLPREEMIASGWIDEAGTVNERFKSPAQGAATSVWAATSPQLVGLGGVYCEDCDIAEVNAPGDPDSRIRGVFAYAVDPAAAEGLWALSAELTGVNAFAR